MPTKTFFFLLFFPFMLFAQINTPPASVPMQSETQVGLTNFEITYSRPSVNGRKIFGELVPYSIVWRSGANASTLLRFDKPIKIDDGDLKAGTYALFTIPGEDEWTIVLNTDTTLWGASGYDMNKDAVRLKVKPRHLSERIETLEYRWMDVTDQSVSLALEWENVRVKLPINLSTNAQVESEIEQHLGPNAKGNDYYKAASYYIKNNLDLEKASLWIDKQIELDGEKFWALRKKALLEWKMGDYQQARTSMERSLVLAQESSNEHYANMDTHSLRQWAIDTLGITAEEILGKSIQYHDPEGSWAIATHSFHFYEGRPDGGYRITDIDYSEADEYYSMVQRKERNLITQILNKGVISYDVDGKSDLSEEELKAHRLNPERSELIRNYYAYLWGLPMKLKDPGTILGDVVRSVDFFGERLIEIRVTYTAEVGHDIWYFYFDPATYAMKGYRFYHDEAANDGEFILIEDEAKVGSMILPAKRHWYTHKNRRYLGSDELID